MTSEEVAAIQQRIAEVNEAIGLLKTVGPRLDEVSAALRKDASNLMVAAAKIAQSCARCAGNDLLKSAGVEWSELERRALAAHSILKAIVTRGMN